MRIWAIARITFAGFLRDRIQILFAALFLCILLPNLVPMILLRSTPRDTPGAPSPVLGELSDLVTMAQASGFSPGRA